MICVHPHVMLVAAGGDSLIEAWTGTVRAAIGFLPNADPVDFMVTVPGKHRTYRVVSLACEECVWAHYERKKG